MSTVKNLNSGYTIQTPKAANVTVNTDWVIINGNLEVLGNTVSITTTDTNILDNTIVLNYGETGNGVTKDTSGIVVDRGQLANVDLRWNESILKWEFSNNGTDYANLGISTSNLFGANLELSYVNGTIPDTISNTSIIYADTVMGGRTGVYIVSGDVSGDELISKKRALGLSLLL